jgi:hypothetical protein
VSDDFELLGAPNASRTRDVRVRAASSGPQHPDFTPGDDVAADDDSPGKPGKPGKDDAAAPVSDAAVDFAHVGHLVNRMRAAFFSGDS